MQKQRQKRISVWVMLIFACMAVAACVSLPLLMPAPMAVFQASGLEAGNVMVETLDLSEKIPFPSDLAFHPIRKSLFVTSQDRDQRWVYEVEIQTGKVTKWKSGGSIVEPPPSSCPRSDWWEVRLTTGQCHLLAGSLEGLLDDYPSIVIDSQGQIYLGFSYSNLGLFSILEEARGQIHQIKLVSPESSDSPIVNLFPTSESSRFKDSPNRFVRPRGFTIDPKGVIYLTDWGNQMIRKIENGFVYNLAGSPGMGYENGKGKEAKFTTPFGIAQDSEQSLYVTDKHPSKIRKITKDGTVTTFAGPIELTAKDEFAGMRYRDGKANTALFLYLTAILIDKQDNIYVSDTGNQAIRKITPEGDVSTLAGQPSSQPTKIHATPLPYNPALIDGPGSEARFHSPIGLALDDQGVLYVADRGNQAIRRIKPIGEQKKVK